MHLCMGGAQIDATLESSKLDVLARVQHVRLVWRQRLLPGVFYGVGLRQTALCDRCTVHSTAGSTRTERTPTLFLLPRSVIQQWPASAAARHTRLSCGPKLGLHQWSSRQDTQRLTNGSVLGRNAVAVKKEPWAQSRLGQSLYSLVEVEA